MLLLFDLSGPPPKSSIQAAWIKARNRCLEIAETRNVADFLYPPQQQQVDTRDQIRTHRASDHGPGSQGYRPRYRDFASEESYRRAAEEQRTADFLLSQEATPARINTPPPPPGPPPPNYPPPREMMATKYYGVPEDTRHSVGGSKYGFRNVEQNSRM